MSPWPEMEEWVFEASKNFFVLSVIDMSRRNNMTYMEERILVVEYRAMTRMIAIVIDNDHSHLNICGNFFCLIRHSHVRIRPNLSVSSIYII